MESHVGNEGGYRRFAYQGTIPAHLQRVDARERQAFIRRVEDVYGAGPTKLTDHWFVRLLDRFVDGGAERRIAAIINPELIGLAVCYQGCLRLAAAPNVRDLVRKNRQQRCYIPDCQGEWKCKWQSPDGPLDWRMYVDRDGTIKIVREINASGLVRYATVNPTHALLGPTVRYERAREA
jgi:hypothetical protein